jgi:hypothetical protein
MRPDREQSVPEDELDLAWLTDNVYRLCGFDGRPFRETTVGLLHKDPVIRAIVLDLQFPANPFAP